MEGYTDVMAAHVAGVDTAVASCGTAFGDDHARLLRRLMGNHDAFRGEVIFTFDGDAAGQAAALKVFGGDANFIAQTYVAVEPSGLDPCDLRLQHGDAAVRELVARRVPLYRFVMANILTQHDLDRADGRLSALREAAPLVSSIRDSGLIGGYVRELAGMLGMDVEEVRREVMRSAARHERSEQRPTPSARRVAGRRPSPTAVRTAADPSERADPPTAAQQTAADRRWLPEPDDRLLVTERETMKLLLQAPLLFEPDWLGLGRRGLHPPRVRRRVPLHADGPFDASRRPRVRGGVGAPGRHRRAPPAARLRWSPRSRSSRCRCTVRPPSTTSRPTPPSCGC